MRQRRDWGIIGVVTLAAICWYALYEHEALTALAYKALASLRRKY